MSGILQRGEFFFSQLVMNFSPEIKTRVSQIIARRVQCRIIFSLFSLDRSYFQFPAREIHTKRNKCCVRNNKYLKYWAKVYLVAWPSGLRRWFQAPVSLRRGFESHRCHLYFLFYTFYSISVRIGSGLSYLIQWCSRKKNEQNRDTRFSI